MSLPWMLCIAICLAASAFLGWKVWTAPVFDDPMNEIVGDGSLLDTDLLP